jgi:TRAP-type uncharacterized transport system fused permease subunit
MPTPNSSPQHRDLGALLIGLGALLLLVSLFLHWYQPGRSAWTVFEVWDLVLAALAGVAFAGALGRLGLAPGRWERWTPACSAAALVIVAAALINHPPAAEDAGPMVGIWLALVAAGVMLGGVVLTTARVSLVVERRMPQPPTPAPSADAEPTTPIPAARDDDDPNEEPTRAHPPT